jgi:hypothetical protein
MGVDAAYRLTADNSIRLSGIGAWYTADGGMVSPGLASLVPEGLAATPSFFMPTSYRQIGLHWVQGNDSGDEPQRRWRPYWEIGAIYADTTGAGYDYRFGCAGPVIGKDRLSLGIEGGRSGISQGETLWTSLLRYLLLF